MDDADAASAPGSDAISTVSLNVGAVKRAVAEGASDATATIALPVAAIKQAMRSRPGSAQAPTIAFPPIRVPAEADTPVLATVDLPDADLPTAEVDAADATELADSDGAPTPSAEPISADDSAEAEPEADFAEAEPAEAEPAEFEPAEADSAEATSTDLVPTTSTDVDTSAYLASTDLAMPASGVVAVPTTADDVIATIHAAATVVRAADLRARRAAFAKADPWTDLDLHKPAVPAPVDNVLDLLSPVLERPLLVVEQPGLPDAADVVALHRSEFEVDFVEPPVVAAGAEPPIPPRYGPGLSVLPHIEFPV